MPQEHEVNTVVEYTGSNDLVTGKIYKCIKNGRTFQAKYQGPVLFPLDADSGHFQYVYNGKLIHTVVQNNCVYDI